MCGIAGYVGSRPSSLELYSALQRLEYRGYDSAGLVIGGDGADLQVHRCRGSVAGLSDSSRDLGKPAGIQFGLAHTRWATHGEPSERNAHPHLDCGGRLAVVHNGIIANHRQLRAELEAAGHTFRSETDSEVLAHLVEDVYEDDLVAAVRAALERVEGSYALGVLHQERAELVAARRGGPLVVGCAEGEAFLASDVTAFIDRTHEVVFLEDGDIARLDEHSIEVFDLRGNQRSWTPVEVPWRVEDTSRGGFRHFMRKEIDEQPQVLEACLNGRCGDVVEVPEVRDLLADGVPEEILITACGTSFHAGSIAADYLERLAGIPTRVLLGSEYSNWVRAEPAGRWLLALSQSGETADTLAAVRGFRASGGRVLAICNTLGSSLVREADATVLTQAGPEIGVASTKAFTSQVLASHLAALTLASHLGSLSADELSRHRRDLDGVGDLLVSTLGRTDAACREIAPGLESARGFLFLGRGRNVPVAAEGALKMKELTYIPSEAYATGEMKHGPLALVDDRFPSIVFLDPEGPNRSRGITSIEEILTRGGPVVVLTQRPVPELIGHDGARFLHLPEAPAELTPLLFAVAAQLLAYHVADGLGREIDRPRNLAKSVTVE